MEKSDFGLTYLCLTENVSSEIANLALFSHDFACLQETILIWIPCGFLLCMLPFQFYQLISSNVKKIGWTTLNLLKTIVTSCLILLSVSNCVYRIHQWTYLGVEASQAQYAAPFILTLTLCLALVFIELDRRKGIHTSAILFCFWLLLVMAGFLTYIAHLIDLISHSYIKEIFSFAFCMIYYPLVCGEFVLACYKDIPTWTVVSEDKNVCPDQQAGFLSVLLFWWFNKLIWKGYKNPIVKEDLWVLNNANLTSSTSNIFEHQWKKKENLGKKASLSHLIWTLIRGFGLSYMVTFFLRAGAETIPFIQPFILKLLIQYIENKGEEEWKGYAYAIVLFILSLINTLLLQQYYYKCLITGMKIKSAVISAVFRKSLRLSNSAKKSSTTGEIVNLMSVDAQRFIDAMLYFNLVWTTPVQILVTLYFLYTILGVSVVAGIGVICILLTCNGIIVSKWAYFENEEMNEKDKRMKVINEVLNGIKVLKLYAWEIPFEKVISDLREKELTFRKYLVYMLASATVSWMCTPFLVSLACYIMFIFYDNGILSPQIAFVSLSFFNLLRFPLFMLPEVISVMIQLRVSLKRLANFLSNDELDPNNVINEFKKGVSLEIENGSFSWDKDKDIILHDVNMVVNDSQLVAIVGQVGSGKSSLISACLGEMEKVSGKVVVKNKTAYVPQQAWIQNNTVRGNILFNKLYRENKYNSVIEACALTADLEVLPGGDKTEIGEKGINLSGGQKQRISLARAVYNNADIYFLDDPLSAVDAHVGKHIFDNIIGPSGLLKDKTRIFATNAISYLPYVDLIIVLVKGKISEVGSYQQLLTQNGAFSEFLQNYMISSSSDQQVTEKSIEIIEDVMTSCEGLDRSPSLRILNRGISVISVEKSQKELESPKSHSRLIEDEILETGDVKLRVYILYLKYATYLLVSLVCIFTLLASTFNIASTIWLKEWSADPAFNSSSFTEINIKTRDLRLAVYASLGIGQGIFTLLYYMMMGIGFISASRTLHKQLLINILKSPMHFFDTTPLGRIVNRFGKDIDYVDHYITRNIDEILYFGVQVLSIFVVISYSTPIFMIILIPLGIIYYFIQRFYIITSRQLKRLESISRSPIYSHFQESLAGVVTIRAYKQDEIFILESESRVDANHSAFFTSIASNRWLSVRLEFVGNCVVFFAALFAVLSRDVIDPGIMGLSISYALMLTQGMSWMVIVACELETNIVAVERIQDYSEGVTEADWVIEKNRPSIQWPENGNVSFENYQTRYRPGLDLVLKGINCNIVPGEKIGIAGRTGAGKSSLTLGLFRIIEAASGSITIDNTDISKIGLHDLRSKLTIIPQDPVLFSGTLRMNLDPFNNNSDDELWTALEQSHLKNFVNSITLGLQHEITEGGENLSVGQRQLVCLARALLRKTKVLVLDEATAAIDLETDDLIQNTIRKEFKDCTILTIAHRLNTIMDSDRVMVLDQGVIKEFDTPSQLLLDTSSIFYMMSKDAGLLSENHKD